MFKKEPLKNQQILVLVRLLNASTKMLVFLALFGQLWSLVPWSAFQVQAATIDNQELITDQPSFDNYPTTTDPDFDQSQVAIESEMIDERTETSKTFRKVDGTYEVAMYNNVIHYQKDEKWEDIDNSLYDTGNELENKANKFQIKFPKQLDDNKQIKLSQGAYSIDWNILDINSAEVSYNQEKKSSDNLKELTNISQSVLYDNVRPFTDVEYIVSGNKVKENIILSQYVLDFSMTFEYKLKNLSLIQDEQGNIIFLNDNNETIFSFIDLIMFDNDLNDSSDIDLQLIVTGNKTYQIFLTPSDEWLQKASYPVVIDPTISSVEQSINIYDTYVSESSPNSNYENYSYIAVSNTTIYNEYRGLFSFDIPVLLMDKEIVHSTFTLTSNSKSMDRIIGLYENNSAFDVGEVDWYSRPSHSSDMIDYHIVGSDNIYMFDITDIVKEWQSTGNVQTPGFTIKDNYDYGAYNSVNSSESSESLQPVVEFIYIDSTGMKDYWSYSQQNAGNAGVGYVSDNTGKLIFIKNEVSYETAKQSFGFSLIYNIDRKDTNIGYGLGWQTNYSMTYQTIIEGQEYSITDGTGNTVHYYPTTCDSRFVSDSYNQYTCYIAEDGSGNIFYKLINPGTVAYYMMTRQQVRYSFENMYLKQITDIKTSIDINIYRNPLDLDEIDYITDESGNQIDLSYSSGRLLYTYLKVKQSENIYHILEKVNHDYTYKSEYADYALYYTRNDMDYNEDLTFTSSPTNYYITDSYARLTSVYEASGKKVAYTYYEGNTFIDKVWTINQYVDQIDLYSTIEYYYGSKMTIMTDQNNNYIIYKFDNYGHTVNILDSYGYAQSFSYLNLFSGFIDGSSTLVLDGIPNYNWNHQLLSKSDPYKTIENVVQNYSFETSKEMDISWMLDQPSYPLQQDYSNFSCDTFLYGDCSARLLVPDAQHYGSYKQTVVLDYGNYMLSGYVKNDTLSGNVNISISGDEQENISADVDNDSNWHYVEVIVDVDDDNTLVTIELNNFGIGDVYFDNIQLIEGFRDTRKNIVNNSSFEVLDSYGELSNWYGFDSSYIFRTPTSAYTSIVEEDILGDYAIRFNGDAKTLRYIWSDYNNYINDDLVDGTLTIGGWAYSNSTPMSIQSTDIYPEVFRIRVDVLDTYEIYGSQDYEDSIVSTSYVNFDTAIQGWQFQLKEVPFEAGNHIFLTLEYEGEGYVLFDQIQMYYEPIYSLYDYDIYGRLETIYSSSGETTNLTYENDGDERATKVETEFSTLELGIDDAAALIESVTYNSVTSEQSFNSYGQVTGTLVGDTDNYFTTSTAYLTSGFSQFIASTTNEFGKTTNYYTYTLTGLLKAISNANGDDLLYIYDDEGKLIKAVHVDDYSAYQNGDSYYSIVEYLYDSEDRLDKIILDRNSSGTPIYYYDINYDAQDRISNVLVNSTSLMSYTYEKDGDYYTNRISTQTYGNGDVISFFYDDEGQIIGVNFDDTTKFSYEYDQSGLLAIYNEHDNEGNILKSEYYTYDISGQLSQMVDSYNNTIQYTYDASGNIESLDFTFEGMNQETEYFNNYCLSWNIQGSCIVSSTLYDKTIYETQDGYDISKRYLYEIDNVLKRVEYVKLFENGSLLIEQSLNYIGDTTRIHDISYSLKDDDNLYKYSYTYDDVGNIIRESYYEDGFLKFDKNYAYDELNQLIVEDSRDYDIPLSSTLTETNYTKYYYYDNRGNITDIKTFLYGQDDYEEAVAPTEYDINYGSDPIFVVISGDTEIPVNGSLSLGFTYYKLEYVMPPNPVTLPMVTIKDYTQVDTTTPGYYLIDCIGKDKFGGSTYNLEFGILITVGTPSSGPTIPQEHIHYNYSESWLDQLESIDNITYNQDGSINTTTRLGNYEYDDQGNPDEMTDFYYNGNLYDHAALVYDGRQLSMITLTDATLATVEIEYSYNDQGYRTSKTINGSKVEYFLEGDKALFETDGTYGIIYTYDYDGSLISFNYDDDIDDSTEGIEYYYIKNIQGDITKIVDHDGDIVVKYEYDVWGNIVKITDGSGINLAEINPYRYRSYRYDEEINMYYLNSRYYNPVVGRFINADGMLGQVGNALSTNMYAYCANNPVMFTDPSGEFPILIAAFIIGAVISGTASTISQGATDGWENINWSQVGFDSLIGGVTTLVGASGIGVVGAMIVGGTLGFTGSVGSDLIAGNGDWSEVNWTKAGIMTVVGIGLGGWSGSGAQNFKTMNAKINLGQSWGSKSYINYGVSVIDRAATSYARHTASQLLANAVRGYQAQAISRALASALYAMGISEFIQG
ncbi:DNRLRE domain-containing protein [Mariniplasma anaerobium]|uniref:Uncharacterized protein n=1 Tax=Mariniplasma anaerobium TaxID=2735436 RepID=A0A7U9XUL9_9MOLU|nr:DNRLRE domain-containing protein [Mariniplasma anaerobium]BCR35639.1 hypothetical protein MPAN_005320 [Mariniplasma anaerobium]